MSEDQDQNEQNEQSDSNLPAEPWRDSGNGRFRATARTEGDPRWRGRPRGSPNKTTVVLRTAIAAVFEDLQEGHKGKGAYPHFLAWAKENPTEFYRIAARQLPLQVEATGRAIGVVVFNGLN